MSLVTVPVAGSRRNPGTARHCAALLAVVLLAAGTLLTSCSAPVASSAGAAASSSVTRTATSTPPGTLPLESADGLHLPIEQYLATGSETNEIQAAQQLLTIRCMSTFGFTFSYPPQTPVTGQDPDAANMSRRYGITDARAVAEYGYQPPPRPTPPVDDLVSSISEAEYDVLFGRTEAASGDSSTNSASGIVTTTPGGARIPAGGCTEQAGRELVPGVAPTNASADPGCRSPR